MKEESSSSEEDDEEEEQEEEASSEEEEVTAAFNHNACAGEKNGSLFDITEIFNSMQACFTS